MQQMYASSVLEAESAHPLEDLGSESGIAAAAVAKKRAAASLDTVITALGRRLSAAAARPPCSSCTLRAELHNPKNPEYVAVRDTESAKGVLGSILVELRTAGISVSPEEMRDALLLLLFLNGPL